MPTIDVVKPGTKGALTFYGGNADFFYDIGPECGIGGPFETGKTMVATAKLHTLLTIFPRARGLMLRKTYKSLIATAAVTYETKVLPYPPDHERSQVKAYGGARPEFYQYPNGSKLILGGLDNPDKVLSAEYDYIYVPQAEELTLNEWEILGGRATGRAGNVPWPQVFLDCNPGPPTHWIVNRQRLEMYKSRHEDNPVLFNQRTGVITEQGIRSMAALDALTGVRYKRGRQGLWVAAEGAVYEDYDPIAHLIKPFPIPKEWPRFRSIDFGYRNPFVCQWWAISPDDEMFMYREIYMSERTVRVHAEKINELSAGENIIATVADHDASDRATLEENGIYTVPAAKDILQGIEVTQERFVVRGNNRAGIYFFMDATVEKDPILEEKHLPTSTVEELGDYAYPTASKANRNEDELPIDKNNHGCDSTRYMVMYFDEPGQRLSVFSIPDPFGR